MWMLEQILLLTVVLSSQRLLEEGEIDNLIQLAHNTEIGENTVIAAQAGISGSTKVGKNCIIGGQAGLVGHITLADNTKNPSAIRNYKNSKEGQALYGSPALTYNNYVRSYTIFKRLPELLKQVELLEVKNSKFTPRKTRLMKFTNIPSKTHFRFRNWSTYWSKVKMTICPAKPNFGLKFQRVDLDDQPTIDADVDNVIDVRRGTTLQQNGAKINTVEHILAALVGLEIDNALIQLNGPEVPIMDGSAKDFIEAIESIGLEEQNAQRNFFEIPESVFYQDKDKNVEITALPLDDYRLTVMIDYNSRV